MATKQEVPSITIYVYQNWLIFLLHVFYYVTNSMVPFIL